MAVVPMKGDNLHRLEQVTLTWFRMNRASSVLHAQAILPNGRWVRFQIKEWGSDSFPVHLICDGVDIGLCESIDHGKRKAVHHLNTLSELVQHPVVVAPDPPKEKTLAGGKPIGPIVDTITGGVVVLGGMVVMATLLWAVFG